MTANDIKTRLGLFLKKYGNDFFTKLPLYKTAKCNGVYVTLIAFEPTDFTFTVKDVSGQEYSKIDLFKMTDFCL